MRANYGRFTERAIIAASAPTSSKTAPSGRRMKVAAFTSRMYCAPPSKRNKSPSIAIVILVPIQASRDMIEERARACSSGGFIDPMVTAQVASARLTAPAHDLKLSAAFPDLYA